MHALVRGQLNPVQAEAGEKGRQAAKVRRRGDVETDSSIVEEHAEVGQPGGDNAHHRIETRRSARSSLRHAELAVKSIGRAKRDEVDPSRVHGQLRKKRKMSETEHTHPPPRVSKTWSTRGIAIFGNFGRDRLAFRLVDSNANAAGFLLSTSLGQGPGRVEC